MNGSQAPELTQEQARVLQKLLQAGFQFASIEHVARHIVVEKGGFIALLDPAEGNLKLFSQVGYRMGEEIGMLVEQNGNLAFVWKKQAMAATPELLASYERVKVELAQILKDE